MNNNLMKNNINRNRLSPLILYVRTTKNCNAGCFMCDFARKTGEDFMSQEQLNNIVSQSKKAGIKLIRFTGGEPLLDKNIGNYVKFIKQNGIKTSIITNGYLLPIRSNDLIEAGVDQIIVSLDGSNAKLHNKLRNSPRLFENLTEGIRLVKQSDKTLTRVNTVVSPYNIDDLENIMNLIIKLGVDQWSIIPLKGPINLWKEQDLNKVIKTYKSFIDAAEKQNNKLEFLGYSVTWAGRDENEVNNYFKKGIPFRPKKRCYLVDRVRFYIPASDKLSACNCVPWRLREIEANNNVGISGLNDNSLSSLVEYLHKQGPSICTGCEPINAYLGEHSNVLDKYIFKF